MTGPSGPDAAGGPSGPGGPGCAGCGWDEWDELGRYSDPIAAHPRGPGVPGVVPREGTAGGRPPGPAQRLDADARLTAWVRGRVQGVGFRWWVRRNALELDLLGAAENLVDGRVKIVAEGARENLVELLDRLESPATPGLVAQVTHRWDPVRGGFDGFVERLWLLRRAVSRRDSYLMACELRKRQLDRMALEMGPWMRYLRAA